MSWSRFSNADVYTFPNMDGKLECCSCSLLPDYGNFTTGTVDTFLKHLGHHRDAGHDIPTWLDVTVLAEGVEFGADRTADKGNSK